MRYVLGFAFYPDLSKVILIKKTKPQWQANRINGIGGHIKEYELSCDAMKREFKEETATGDDLHWVQYAKLHGADWEVDIYRTVMSTMPRVGEYLFVTDEGTVSPIDISELKNQPVLPNLLYLIPMAINHILGTDKCKFFDIREEG